MDVNWSVASYEDIETKRVPDGGPSVWTGVKVAWWALIEEIVTAETKGNIHHVIS